MNGHVIASRKAELIIGILVFIFGAFLIYDASDRRGKSLPWPLGAVLPW